MAASAARSGPADVSGVLFLLGGVLLLASGALIQLGTSPALVGRT